MITATVTSKGQVTIPKRVRDALGITAGSKVEFNVVGGDAQMRLIRARAISRIEDGPGILDYKGPRIPITELQGAAAVNKSFCCLRRD